MIWDWLRGRERPKISVLKFLDWMYEFLGIFGTIFGQSELNFDTVLGQFKLNF